MFLDVDEFKQVNDTLGHEAGDRLLEAIVDRLSVELRDSDVVVPPAASSDDRPSSMIARIGGDEFTLMLPRVTDPGHVAAVAERILNRFAEPFVLGRQSFNVGTSIGITLYQKDGESTEILTKNADLAMYQAKHMGKNTYRFFKTEMNEAAQQRVQMERRLRRAIDQGCFEPHYQPLVDLSGGQMVGVEALLRWRCHETGQMISPAIFIPVAEENVLITVIGEWVLGETCEQAKAWQDQGLPPIQVSVNASGVQLENQDLAALTERILQRTGLQAKYLELELTETSVMSAVDKAADNLRRVKALGVSIALDDFGTGYSSLNYLRQFAIDKVKIDRSFISEITAEGSQRSIVAAIIAMAHTLGLKVVAEGIEQSEEVGFLLQHHCDIGQGYLFSRPLPADQLALMLANQDGIRDELQRVVGRS